MKFKKIRLRTKITMATAMLLFSTQLGAQNLQSDMLFDYTFDNMDGKTVVDQSSNNNPAHLEGNADLTSGYNEKGVFLSEKTDFIRLPENISQNLTSFTFMAWVKFNALNASTRLLDLGNTATDNALVLIPSFKDNYGYLSLRFQPYRGIIYNVSASQKIPVGSWTHIAVTYNWDATKEKGEACIYLNGLLVGVNSKIPHSPAAFLGETKNNYLGYSRDEEDTTGFNGTIDEVKMYNRALSSTEIAQVSSLERNEGDLLIRFDFSKSNDTQVSDVSKYKHTGTMKNDAHIRTMGTSATGIYNVLDLGNANGYFDLGKAAGSSFTQLKNYTISSYFRIDENYTSLDNPGNFIWTFSNSEDITSGQNGYMAASLSDQSVSISNKTPDEGKQTISLSMQALSGNWHHLAFTQNGSTATLYIDGIPVKSGSMILNPQNNLSQDDQYGTLFNWLGRSCIPGQTTLGKTLLYDFRLYRKALSEDEIRYNTLDVERELQKLERAFDAHIAPNKTAETMVYERILNPAPQSLEIWLNDASSERISLGYINQIHFANDEIIIEKSDGNYTASLINLNYMQFSSIPVSVSLPEMICTLNIYPNPSAGLFNITFENHATYNITVHSLSGHELMRKTISGDNTMLDIRHFDKGIYLLKVNESVQKLVKN